ncbi:MAG: hypothetical protein AB7G93_05050 [Bdellovibrionales bacterium]
MSWPNKNSKPGTPALLVLLVSLGFSLSSLPGTHSADLEHGSVELASESCSLDDQLRVERPGTQTGVASCDVEQDIGKEKVEGAITARVEQVKLPEYLRRGDPKKEETEPQLVIEAWAKGTCPDGGCLDDRVSSGPIRVPLRLLRESGNQIQEKAKSLFREQAKKVASRKKKELEEARKAEKCLDKKEGQERMECRLEKMAEMDAEKAQGYYKDNIHKEIIALIGSDDPSKRKLALDLVTKLQAEGGHDFLPQEIAQLRRFADVRLELGRTQADLKNLALASASNPNDPALKQSIQTKLARLATLEGISNSYTGASTGSGTASQLAALMQQNITSENFADYQKSLMTAYSNQMGNVSANHRRMVDNSGSSPRYDQDSPRTRRGKPAGTPSTTLGNGPAVPANPVTPFPGQQRPGGPVLQQPVGAPPLPGAPAAPLGAQPRGGKPGYGTRAR